MALSKLVSLSPITSLCISSPKSLHTHSRLFVQHIHHASQVLQVIVVIPDLAARDGDFLLALCILRHRAQKILELFLRDFGPQLAGPRQHDQPVLHVRGAGFLYQADAPESFGGFGRENLGEDGGAGFGFAVSGVNKELSVCERMETGTLFSRPTDVLLLVFVLPGCRRLLLKLGEARFPDLGRCLARLSSQRMAALPKSV